MSNTVIGQVKAYLQEKVKYGQERMGTLHEIDYGWLGAYQHLLKKIDEFDNTPLSDQSTDIRIGEHVFLFYRNLRIEGNVIGVHLIKDKVKYDIELTFYSAKWAYPVTTRIYNVNSAFVTKNQHDLPLIEGLKDGTENMDESIRKALSVMPDSQQLKDIEGSWRWIKAELSLGE